MLSPERAPDVGHVELEARVAAAVRAELLPVHPDDAVIINRAEDEEDAPALRRPSYDPAVIAGTVLVVLDPRKRRAPRIGDVDLLVINRGVKREIPLAVEVQPLGERRISGCGKASSSLSYHNIPFPRIPLPAMTGWYAS